jgi:electron transport complex protein RnfB
MLTACISLSVFAIVAATVLLRARPVASPAVNEAIDRADALLPQTQCRQCGFDDCRSYAEALIRTGAPLNRCRPGGDSMMRALAELLGQEPQPVADGSAAQPHLVSIVAADCIGCTQCLRVCPVDAIVGVARQAHVVIQGECTACGLCLPACPAACIVTAPAPVDRASWQWPRPDAMHA